MNKDNLIDEKSSITAQAKDNIKVACILDEFSYECFKYEATFFQLSIKNWKESMDNLKPDFLFVESAWEGYKKEWVKKISFLNFHNDNTLLSLVKYCNYNNIPTVFWAKEDPHDFNTFIEAARHFDYIFTIDLNSVLRYRQILKHNNIFVLPFAAQPRIHNPINKDKEKIGKVAFAGGWYNKFPKRCKAMENILKPAFKYNLTIYDRFKDSSNKQNLFPPEYDTYIKDSLKYKDMISQYKAYQVFLNVNSIALSPTAFSRRVFELLASGIPTISSYSKGIDNLLKDIVFLSKSQNDTKELLNLLVNNKELRDRISVLGIREVLNHHTYTHRFNRILNKLGIRNPVSLEEGVSVVSCTNRLLGLEDILSNYNSQLYPLKELILVVNNDFMDLGYWDNYIKQYDNIKLYKLPKATSLEECVHFAMGKVKYPYISMFNDDSYYGPNYLVDSINAFKYTDADMVGKNTFYRYIKDSQLLALDYPYREHQYSEYVASSTLTFKKEVTNFINFQYLYSSEDTDVLADCIKGGIKIYSTDRFNYIMVKKSATNKKKYKFIKKTKDYKSIVSI